MTKADMEQVTQLMDAGNIRAARNLLQSLDDPRALKALEKLNRLHPAVPAPALGTPKQKPPPARGDTTRTALPPELRLDEMDEIKEAIREKRYDDAEALLVLSDHPDAEKLRDRLSAIRGGGSALKVKRVYEAEEKDLTAKFQITFFLLIFLTVFGLIALGIFVPEAKKYPNAPGAGGLLLMNKIVRFILYGMLIVVGIFLVLLVVVGTQPVPRY
jgi:hypothetical protein